jgi:integrase
MARPRNPIPTARCHKGSAVVDVYQGGKRRTVTLGPWGSVQADKEFARMLAERNGPAAGNDPTIAEIFLAFLKHAEAHYRQPDGTTSPEVDEFKALSKFTRELYAHTAAREFGPLALKTLREALVGRGLCRRIVNQRIGRLKRVFKWAASEELLPFDVFHRLTTVPGLQLGRTLAREAEPVLPVDDATVEATLPHLSRHVRGLVRFQRLAGCRPGEACRLKPSEIDMTGGVGGPDGGSGGGLHRRSQRFPNAKAVGRYFGLVPSQDQSGARNRLGHITREARRSCGNWSPRPLGRRNPDRRRCGRSSNEPNGTTRNGRRSPGWRRPTTSCV